MAPSRYQIRSLLIPGCYQAGGDRGVPFEDDEIDLVVDAYINSGMPEAMRVLRRLTAMPYLLQRQQERLRSLRSVSAAYKQAQIPLHFRQQENPNVRRKSTQKAARRTPQAPDPANAGTAYQTAPGGVAYYGGTSGGGTGLISAFSNNVVSNNQFYGIQVSSNRNYSGSSGINVRGHFVAPVDIEPPKPLPVEVKAGEIVAWRAWRIINGKLTSMVVDTVWEEDQVVEGDPSADLGVHAWKEEAQARAYAATYGGALAIGTVELWGQVIEHEDGYRAEFAQIKEVVDRISIPQPSRHLQPSTGFISQTMAYPRTAPDDDGGLRWILTGMGAGFVLLCLMLATAAGKPPTPTMPCEPDPAYQCCVAPNVCSSSELRVCNARKQLPRCR